MKLWLICIVIGVVVLAIVLPIVYSTKAESLESTATAMQNARMAKQAYKNHEKQSRYIHRLAMQRR
jgi:beta-lactamase regulating signal transducer with metallopeptidase domain